MKFLKSTLMSSLLLSTMVFAGTFEMLTDNLDTLMANHQSKGYQKPIKEIIIENVSKPQYHPKITEGTNLNVGDHVWKISYSPYSDDGNIVLLNPHPTLETLNQRALQIAEQTIKRRVSPLTETDKQAFKNLFNDENLKKWEQSVSHEEKEYLKPFLVQFTDQDIQDIIDIKQEIQVNFGTFEKDVSNKARERVRSALAGSECSEHLQKEVVNSVILEAKVGEQGRISNLKIHGIDNQYLNTCLSRSIRRQQYMILNQDGVPVSYSFSVALDLAML
ncbi:hypothetical protein [Moraxella lacunata]|nr:hypothetical protein [Moraxella lacunata]